MPTFDFSSLTDEDALIILQALRNFVDDSMSDAGCSRHTDFIRNLHRQNGNNAMRIMTLISCSPEEESPW